MKDSILKNISLAQLNTFKIRGTARFFVCVKTVEDLSEALKFAKKEEVPVCVLGGGSNTLFKDGLLNMLVLKIEIEGINILEKNEDSVTLNVGSGVNWDEVVDFAVKRGLFGIEALSAIPGTAGATPVQNVGAYGQEIKDTLISVEAFDQRINKVQVLNNDQCGLTYRNSIFKQKDNPYIITSIKIKLKTHSSSLLYPELIKYFEGNDFMNVSPLDIRNAVIEIRNRKLPDVEIFPNVGSFFKNALVSIEQAKELKVRFPDMPQYEVGKDIKIPSGWLIEKAGYKGKKVGAVSVSDKNALVLINNGNATFEELENFRDEIIKAIYDMFGIVLIQEPSIAGE